MTNPDPCICRSFYEQASACPIHGDEDARRAIVDADEGNLPYGAEEL